MVEKEIKQLVNVSQFDVRWRDLDAQNHVNNSTFFTYFEEARLAWFMSIKQAFFQDKSQGPVVVSAKATFFKPLYHPDTVEVHTYAHQPGTTSFLLSYELFDKNRQLCAAGDSKMVWVDFTKEKSTPLPDFMLQALAADLVG